MRVEPDKPIKFPGGTLIGDHDPEAQSDVPFVDDRSAAQDRKLTDLVSLREHFESEVRVAREQQTAMPEASEFWRGRAGAFEDALTDLAEWTRGNRG